MSKIYNILIPELVPLENKGEEAIVRGIADVIFPEGNYELHLFDEIDEYKFKDGIHIYPVKWFISPWLNREFCLGFTKEKIRDSFQSLLRNGLHKFIPNWVKMKDKSLLLTMNELKILKNSKAISKKYKGLENILKLDYIIAGHDGAMDERVCHVITEMKKILDLPLGVFGVEFPQKFKSKVIVEEQEKVLKESLFFYCRTDASKAVVDKYFPSIISTVKPDPAFGMIPETENFVDDYLKHKNLLNLFNKPVIVCTTCETGPIARYCFEDEKTPQGRLNKHREFYASLIKYIDKRYDVNMLFLPHAIGPGKALVASDIINRIGSTRNEVQLLKDDISAKLLKGIIKKSEFLIAERIHSMIGAVGVNTPFICLGSKTDRRIEGIISKMVGAKDSVYYMNNPDINEVYKRFDLLWENRVIEKDRLKNVSIDFQNRHYECANIIKKAFDIK